VTEDRANWRKTNEIQKTGRELTDSWQRDLAELISVSRTTIYFFKTAGFSHSPTPPPEIIQLVPSFPETFEPSQHPICRSMRIIIKSEQQEGATTTALSGSKD
jgi:hypothetical protein